MTNYKATKAGFCSILEPVVCAKNARTTSLKERREQKKQNMANYTTYKRKVK